MELEEEKLSASSIVYQTFKSNAIQGKGLKKILFEPSSLFDY